jgi:hypothetical protein
MRLDGMERCVRMIGPPAEMSLGETAGDEPETVAVIAKQFKSGGATIAEDKKSAREGIFGELTFAKRRQSVDPVTEIDRLAGNENAKLGNELDHREPPRIKVEQISLTRSAFDGGRESVR